RACHVTGVQTCALPIFYLNELGDMHDGRLHRVTEQWQLYQQSVLRLLDEITARMSNTNVHFHTQPEPDSTVHMLVEQVAGHSAQIGRACVGKEGAGRWE